MHSVHAQSQLGTNVSNWWLPNYLQWSAVDEGTDGRVRFLTTVEISGQNLSDIPESALCRLACYYLIGHLDTMSLANACQSLGDIFSWQQNRLTAVLPAPTPARLRANVVREVPRVPFALEG
jgi:hypothetical protein